MRNACQENNETAKALILAADLTMPQNSISFCIDQAGVYYRIPIACINDPVNYEKDYQNKILQEKKRPDEKNVVGLKIRMLPDKNMTEDISNLTSIAELK